MPNIFTISPYMCLEDRFTLYWEYLLYHNYDLGQEVVNYIADQTGIPRSLYTKCQDHPFFNGVDQPDLMLVCEDYDLICEHKIESPLGDRQLQRYCELKTDKTSYVILISNSGDTVIDQDVLDNSKYLKPNKSSCSYFLWENFYPIIKNSPSHIAKEFCEYMDNEGMIPWDFGEWGDPFTDEQAKEQFRQIWMPVIQFFKSLNPPAKVCKIDPMGIGLQIQRPTPDLRLIYFSVKKNPLRFSTGLNGRGISMKVYGTENEGDTIKLLPEIEERISGMDGAIYHVKSSKTQKPDSRGYIRMREYGIELDHILIPDITVAKNRLVDFVETSKKHLDNTIKDM